MTAPRNVTELTQALVRIPSVNPHGDTGTDGIGELAIARWLQEYLRSIGAEVELREVLPDRPNVVARWAADRPGKPKLIFAPHTDTVSVAGMTIDPFSGELQDGKVWGRGASDTKGPMAAMLWALAESREKLAGLSHEIWFTGLMSEETSQHGSKALAREEKFDLVVVGEPTSLETVYTHKGSAFLTLVTRGKAGHASRPELGENAIEKMLRLLDFLRSEVAPEFAGMRDEMLGSPTMSIGTIKGGSKTNVIPDHCEASVDLRFIPEQFEPGYAERFVARLKAVVPDVEIDFPLAPPLKSDPQHPVIQKLLACGSTLVGAPWFCDACFFAEQGMPAIAIGPGSILQAHTKDEHIAVKDLEDGVAFFKRFLDSLAV